MLFFRGALGALIGGAVVVAGVACGGDDGDGGSTATNGTGGSATAGPAKIEIPAGAPMVDQDNLTFKPDKLEVKVGDKVYLKNSETAIHTVTLNGRNVSGNMRKGEVVIWTPDKAGEYKMTCDFHPQMKGTITVK